MNAHDHPHRDIWVRSPDELAALEPCDHQPRALATHSHHVLMLCVGGQGALWTGARYHIEQGDVYLIPAGSPHRLEPEPGLRCWGVSLCAGCVQDEALLMPFRRVREGAAAVARTDAAQRARMEYLLEALRSEQALPEQTASAQIQHHALGWLLAEVQRCRFAPGAGALPELVSAALTHIEAHACAGLGLTELARALHKSAGHVTTALREATGCTAQEWIIRFRMAEARRRLLHTAEAVEQIAAQVGYEDTTHFIRMFRRHHDGLTPAAWRRTHAAGERSDKPSDKTERI